MRHSRSTHVRRLYATAAVATLAGVSTFAVCARVSQPAGPVELPPMRAMPPDAAEAPLVPVITPAEIEEPPPIEPGQAPPPGPYAPGFDAVHYDIAIVLPDTGTFIRGRTTARIALVEAAASAHDTLALDLTGLAVARVRIGGDDVAYRYRRGKLRVPMPAGAAAGDTVTVEVVYAGHPDDGLIIGPNVHGERVVFADNWPNRARYWFPSIDHPSDKATVTFAVSAPAEWQVVANGVGLETPGGLARAAARGSEGPGADHRIWRWSVAEVPIPTYTMVIGAAEFVVTDLGTAACGRAPQTPRRCVANTLWLFPPSAAGPDAGQSFARAVEMVNFFTELIAPFPYAKLAHVQSSTRFGGMENVSAIFYADEPFAEGEDFEGTVAHEVAHQWFGDAVTEADWHHLWLSEGFATYFGALFFEHADGVERFREIMAGNARSYMRSDVVDRPIVYPEQDNLFALLNANNYPKGAWVLHMLRGILGDDVFFDGIRRYYRAHVHGTALTRDLREAMEAASGRELGWFFRQWVFEPGYPRFDVDWEWGASAGEALVSIAQVQPADWPTFRTPLTLEFETAGGAVRRGVRIDAREETFRLELPAEPVALRIDPDVWVLHEGVE